MKNMVLLIDTNVLLDYVQERQPRYETSKNVLLECKEPGVDGFVAFHSMSIIWYTLRKMSNKERRKTLSEITDLLTVTAAPHEAVVQAISNENFPDFEDCLQEKCALNIGADYIVTSNVKDFQSSKVLAVTSEEMLKIMYERRIKINAQKIN